MIKKKVNWVLGFVLLLAVVVLIIHTGYLSGAAVSVNTNSCAPITLAQGQGKIIFGKSFYLTSVPSAGNVVLKVSNVIASAELGKTASVEGLTIEVVDTKFTPNVQNRLANLIVCENA